MGISETVMVNPAHRQTATRVRFDWAWEGASAIVDHADVAVLVDVLSFTTSVTVALDVGTTVLPFYWGDQVAAEQYAREHGAALALGRSRATPGHISLSPASIRLAPAFARLVLPSPNGSTLAYELADAVPTCLAASLRNAAAVGAWIARQNSGGGTVAVIAAGERWPDERLRPAIEDMWGPGAVITALREAGWEDLSPGAAAAGAAYEAVRDRLPEQLLACASGRELAAAGFASDVAIAAEIDQSDSVPQLVDGCFVLD